MDQTSFKKQGPRWNASWRGFLADFGAVLEPSWEQFGAILTNSGYRNPSRQVGQVSQAKSVRSGQATKAVDHFPHISLDKGGVPPTNKDVSLPRGLDPSGHEGLGFRIATFWPSCCPSFFHRFFDAIFDRFWLDFASQLGSQNPPKSMKNRCQDAFPC